MLRARLALLVVSCAFATSASAQLASQEGPTRAPVPFTPIVDPPELGAGPDPGCAIEAPAIDAPAIDAQAIATLSPVACFARLDALDVRYERVDDAEGVLAPLRLAGPVAGVVIETHGESDVHDVIDCRLALAIAEWAPDLRAAGVGVVRHFSIYRPGAIVRGTHHVSGHAKGLAIDVAALALDEGGELDVLNGWEARDAGADPCASYAESEASARLRGAICAAVRAQIFQVVLTPHHDRAHQNHVHLELVPGVAWSYVH